MDTLETCIVWCHTVVLQILYGVHTLLCHILLRENVGKFLCSVVAEVEENNHIALANGSVYVCIGDWLDELIGNSVGITFLYRFHHIGSLFSFRLNKKVVSLFHTFPTLIAVHCVEATNDRCDVRTVGVANLLYVGNKACTALRVGIATVHKAMHINIVQTVFLADFD